MLPDKQRKSKFVEKEEFSNLPNTAYLIQHTVSSSNESIYVCQTALVGAEQFEIDAREVEQPKSIKNYVMHF